MITQRQAFRGDPVQLSADQLNAFNRSSNAVQRGKNSLIPGNEKPGTFEILVYAGGEYNPGDVLVIDSPAFPANESLDSGFFTSKSFNVKLSEGAEGEIPVVVAEYIPVDSADFGHGASLTGYVWVKLESYTAGMKYAKPVSGKTTVEPSDSGPFRILSADETTLWAIALMNSGGGGGGGSVGIGRLKSLPSVGSGRGTYVSLTVNTEGEIVETGAAKPVIIPRIYHIN